MIQTKVRHSLITVVEINILNPQCKKIKGPNRVLMHSAKNAPIIFSVIFFLICVLTDISFKLPNFIPNRTKIDPKQMCAQMKTYCAQYKMTSQQENGAKTLEAVGGEEEERKTTSLNIEK